MIRLLDDDSEVNDPFDQPCPSDRVRRYNQIRRILTMVDILAPLRLFHSTRELHRMINDRMGSEWHLRTVARDLEALEEMGLVDCQFKRELSGTKAACWKLRPLHSEPLQHAAILALD